MSGAVGASGGASCDHPEVSFNSAASILKDEDVLLIEHQRPWPNSSSMGCDGAISENASASGGGGRCSCCGAALDEYSLFAVFDGHNGVPAARLAGDTSIELLEARLPPGPPPPRTSPGFIPWREDVQLALVETLAELNKMFAQRGILAGCTATLVLQVGWLLTVANLGDSRAILDVGNEVHMLTVDHRVATHKGERRRVEAMGNTIAPVDFSGSGPATKVDNGVGPLRIWPGGLCLSRAIGDFDVGDAVIPFPNVMQVMVPPTGARMLVASDGVWDAYEKMGRINSMLRGWTLDLAPQRLIQSIVRAYGGLRDDTTLVIADILPPGKGTFTQCAAAVAQRAKAANSAAGSGGGGGGDGGGGCGCFGGAPPPSPPQPVQAAAPAPPAAHAGPVKLEVLADVDVAAVMGLMPGSNPTIPGWYDEYVGEQLFALAEEAMEAWQDAHERRTGRRPSTPPLESSVRAARAAQEALATGEAEPLVDSAGAAWAPATGGSMLRRNASAFFAAAVAEGVSDYADKFGHYQGFKPESPVSSPGNSMHLGSVLGSADGSAHGASGAGELTTARSGGYRYGDASVRAGSRFQGDASTRAGSRFLADPSVRAGAAFYAGQQGAAAAGQAGQPGSRNFRVDPSIRQGTAFYTTPDGKRAAAEALEEEPQLPHGLPAVAEGEQEGRQRGPGAAGAALAAAAGQAGSGAPSSKNGSAAPGRSSGSAPCASASSGSLSSEPIPVPRNVAFGAVTVMGAGAKGDMPRAPLDSASERELSTQLAALDKVGADDSPVDHASMLAQQDSGASSTSMEYMATIAEGLVAG